MDQEQARKFMNDQLEFYLEGRGININKDFHCLNPTHDDKNYRMTIDRSMGQPFHAKCRVCNAFYNTLDLIEIDYRLTNPDAIFDKACEIFNIAPEDRNGHTGSHHDSKLLSTSFKESSWTSRLGSKPPEKIPQSDIPADIEKEPETAFEKYITKVRGQIHQTDYFQKRGLSRPTIDKFKLGYDPDFKTKEGAEYVSWQAVIIPTGEFSFTAINTDHSAEKHNRIRRKGPSTIFNQVVLQNDKPVFVVEEEIEALSLFEAGAEALAVGGSSNTCLLIDIFKTAAPAGGVIICLEDDTEENPFALELGALLHANHIPYIEANICGDYKDLSEALSMARDEFLHTVEATQDWVNQQLQVRQRTEREAYMITNSAHHLQGFVGIKDNVNTVSIPTGFEKLDQLLDGGLYEGLYILAGAHSSGKTSWSLQLSDQIAQNGNDVLIFSLEIARTELMAKSISRLTFTGNNDKSLAVSTRGITTAKKYAKYTKAQQDSIKASTETYGQYADRIYITEGTEHTGVDEIRDILTRHIRITGNRPVIIIDSLPTPSFIDGQGAHQQLNRTVTELKRISRDYRTPILAVSTIDPGYMPTGTQFYPGIDILNSCDVMMGLQAKGAAKADFNLDETMNQNPRELEMKILKNRNGAAGGRLYYNYYPMFNCFIEV